MRKIFGTVKKIIYSSNNFCVFKILSENGKEIICISDLGSVCFNENEKLCLDGDYEINSKYGERFRVRSSERIEFISKGDIEKYLSSSLFTGIGARTAKKIVERFGEDTLDIISNNVDRIKEVEGIGDKKFLEIKSAISNSLTNKEIILKLVSLGLSLENSSKIYNIFHESSIDVIKSDPYILIDKLQSFGFKRADLIRQRLNIPNDHFNRIKYGILYVLKEKIKFGNTFLPYDDLMNFCMKTLLVNRDKICNVYNEILSKGIIVEKIFKKGKHEIRCVFMTSMYVAEHEICSNLVKLFIYYKNKISIDIQREIWNFEKENNIKFSEDQVRTLVSSISNGVHIITGGPGTGKTTIVKFILNVFVRNGFKVIMAAPTGRAAKRMMEATGFEARTIHRILEISSTSEEGYSFSRKSDKNVIKCDTIIVDESSMLDVLLGSKLFSSLAVGTKVIIVGDVNQLPSIGPGNFLKDLMDSNIFPVSELSTIYRQAKNSYIVLNAHKINNGEELVLNQANSDFYVVNGNSEEDICNILKELVMERIPKFFSDKIDNLKDIQILSPVRKGVLGIQNLNSIFQECMNCRVNNKKEVIFFGTCYRLGDKVIQTKNNYDLIGYNLEDDKEIRGVFNGDIGYICDIDGKTISIIYDESKVFKFDKSNLGDIEHAYAITVHKSQGSEFPIVLIPVFKAANFLMNSNILYTGVTRAKKFVVLVGSIDDLIYMVKNTSSVVRYSALKYLFKEVLNLSYENLGGI